MIIKSSTVNSLVIPSDIGLSPSTFPSFRVFEGQSQFDIASDIGLSAKRFRGLCAPPGSGKSIINVSSSLIASPKRTLYLTVNKSLQSQLINEHSSSDSGVSFFSLQGHSSYPCMSQRSAYGYKFGSGFDCQDPNCQYWQDVRASLKHNYIVSNIANWISIAKVGNAARFGLFDYLILDEAHNLESVLCSQLAVIISESEIRNTLGLRIPSVSDSIHIWSEWAKVAIPICLREMSRLEELRQFQDVKSLNRLLSDLEMVANSTPNWVVQSKNNNQVLLTPVFASEYSEKFLFRGIPNIVLSSATLTRDDFEYLGVEDNFTLLDIDPGFDPDKRPFYYWPTCAIDYNTSEGQLRQVVNRIDRIIESRSGIGWKGLIHSISYDHGKKIARFSDSRLILHNKDNFRSMLNGWISSSSPDVMVSPIMFEGLDLKGDLCRYQIIYKVPTLDSRDPITEARKKRSKKYPYYVAGKRIQQAVGRVFRGDGDAGETFILDLHWGRWMQGAIEWPKYFKRACKVIKSLPEPIKI